MFRLACCWAAILLNLPACLSLPDETEDGRFACESAADCVGGFECINSLCCRPENAAVCEGGDDDDPGGMMTPDSGDPMTPDGGFPVTVDTGVLEPDSGLPDATGLSTPEAGVAPLPNGAACTEREQCSSDFCVEGVCCDNACDGVCRSCLSDLTGNIQGLCNPTSSGREQDDECAGASTCDGAGACMALTCPTEIALTFNTAVNGSTATGGWDYELRDWADNGNVACYAATMQDEYRGPYQVYSINGTGTIQWDVVLRPDPGVDASLVAWRDDLTGCAPIDVTGVPTCEASNREGAGGEERVSFVAINSTGFRIVIVVASPETGSPGGFTLAVVNTPSS